MIRTRDYCGSCKHEPCRFPDDSFTHGEKRTYAHGCRCEDCYVAYARSRGRSPIKRGRRDDGYIDDMAVERFISGDIDWRELTPTERLAAAVRMDRNGAPREQIHAATHLNRQRLTDHLIAANGRLDSWRRPRVVEVAA